MVNISSKPYRISKREREFFIGLHRQWKDGFYQRVIGLGIINLPVKPDYDLELLNLSKSFFILYRRTSNLEYASLSKELRRVAHAIHRYLVRQGLKSSDDRFLMLIK